LNLHENNNIDAETSIEHEETIIEDQDEFISNLCHTEGPGCDELSPGPVRNEMSPSVNNGEFVTIEEF